MTYQIQDVVDSFPEGRARTVAEICREVELLLVEWDQNGTTNLIRQDARIIVELVLGKEAFADQPHMESEIAR